MQENVNVWDLRRGDRFRIPGDPRTWTFRSMDGGYCYALSEDGDVLNYCGPVELEASGESAMAAVNRLLIESARKPNP